MNEPLNEDKMELNKTQNEEILNLEDLPPAENADQNLLEPQSNTDKKKKNALVKIKSQKLKR